MKVTQLRSRMRKGEVGTALGRDTRVKEFGVTRDL
jgi:hypothetical protein